MAIIRVSCPTCGQVDVPSDGIELVSIPGRDGTQYTFTCGRCDMLVERPANRLTVTLLTSAGVTVRTPPHPAFSGRSGHPEDPPAGPALTRDDLLDLHLLLDGDDWFDALVAAGRDAAR